jgi:HPt (histidine-containing phosphotransfer) domain-containing protein
MSDSGRFRQEDPIEWEKFPGMSSAFDSARLESLAALETGSCPGLVRDVVLTFLDTVPRSLNTLRDAFLRGDAETVERVAHSLRGSCGLVGARQMAEYAGNVERWAWPSGDEVPEGIRRLEAEWPVVDTTLKSVLARLSTVPLGFEPVH